MKRILWSLALFSVVTLTAAAQTIQVNRENRTIFVSAEGEAKTEAEIATVELTYSAYGTTSEAVYQEAAIVSEKVVAAIVQAGLKQEQIHSGKVSIERVDPEEKWPLDWKKQRLFEASLSWKAVVPVKDAENVVAIAMKSGATGFSDVTWDVIDRTKLQANASKNALEKARRVAESMAAGLNAKLGSLVYASNSTPIRTELVVPGQWDEMLTAMDKLALKQAIVAPTPKVIKLLPERVSEKTTVYAVFAIE